MHHFCGRSAVCDALTSMISLASELRTTRPELSMESALFANYHLLSCDRATLAEYSKLLRFEPCSLLSDAILSSPHISCPQEFLLNSIAGAIAHVNSVFDCPAPSSLEATHQVCKHLTKLWFLLEAQLFE